MSNLLNMNGKSEMHEALLGTFRAMERAEQEVRVNNKDVKVRTNNKGRKYVEFEGYLTVKFRVYAPEDGKSTVMVIVTDLWRSMGESADGRKLSDNPIFWGRVQRGRGDKENLFFFHDNGRPERAEGVPGNT